MVNSSQIEKGLACYMDTQFMTKLPSTGIQRVIIGTTVSIIIKKISNLINQLADNSIMTTLEVVDEEGNVDIDLIAEELKNQIPTEGVSINLGSLVGGINITFHKGDVDEVVRLIKNSSCQQTTILPSNVMLKGAR